MRTEAWGEINLVKVIDGRIYSLHLDISKALMDYWHWDPEKESLMVCVNDNDELVVERMRKPL
jgi:hypothetical protein